LPAVRARSQTRNVVAAAIAVLGLAASGCGSSSSVSAAAYVKQVCSATEGFKQGGQTAVNQYRTSVASAKTIADVKSRLQGYLGTMVSTADRFVSQVKAAGTPDVSNGKQFASALLSAFQQVRTAFSQAEAQVGQVPTNSVAAFRSAAAGVKATLSQADARVGNLGLTKNPQLHAASLKDPTCQALKSGA
jgi:hypothetical protein